MFQDKIILTQTDTTIGFVSQNANRLSEIKKRTPDKHYIKAIDSLSSLKSLARVPNRYKNMIRRAKKSTFILPSGDSYRVIRDTHHLLILKRFGWVYTSSANLSGKEYDEKFAKKSADVIVTPLLPNQKPSTIYKINNKTIKRIR